MTRENCPAQGLTHGEGGVAVTAGSCREHPGTKPHISSENCDQRVMCLPSHLMRDPNGFAHAPVHDPQPGGSSGVLKLQMDPIA